MEPYKQPTRAGQPWRAEEDHQIEQAVQNGNSLEQICALFPRRTPEAVRHRMIRATQFVQNAQASEPKLVNRHPKSGTKWTTEEIDRVKQAIRDGHDVFHTSTLFPGRSYDSVRHRYNRSLQELNLAQANISTANNQPAVSRNAPARKKIRGREASVPWSAEDDQKMQEAVLANAGKDEICAMFPERSVGAIQTRRRKISKLVEDDLSSTASVEGRARAFSADEAVPQSPFAKSMEADSEPLQSEQVYKKIRESSPFTGNVGIIEASHPQNSHLDALSKAQDFPPPPLPYPLKPAIEPSTLSLYGQEPSAAHYGNLAFGKASYLPYSERSDIFKNSGHKPKNAMNYAGDVDMYSRETRALPQQSRPERLFYHSPGLHMNSLSGPAQQASLRNGYGSYLPSSEPANNDYNGFILAVDNHPDLRDGLDFAPISHRPVSPSGFMTSEQLFTDPSIPPSSFMDDDTLFNTDAGLLSKFVCPPRDWNEDVMEE